MSASALLHGESIPENLPVFGKVDQNRWYQNGGSAIAGPNGDWLTEPVVDQEGLVMATIDPREILRERQNFDPTGHYFRGDVFGFKLNKKRLGAIEIENGEELNR